MSDSLELVRGRALVKAIRSFSGVLAGAIMIYLGATGKIIPTGGLPKSAEWGRMLGEQGVRAVSIGIGVLFVVLFSLWARSAVKQVRECNRILRCS